MKRSSPFWDLKRAKHRAVSFFVLGTVLSICFSCKSNREEPRESETIFAKLPAAAERISAANNRFNFDIYRALGSKTGNLCFSPLSLSMAIAEARAGARGETRRELTELLRIDGVPNEDVDESCQAILENLNHRASLGRYKLALHNRVYADLTAKLKKDYVRTCTDRYGNAPQAIDFAGNPDKAREAINRQLEEDVQGRIPSPVPPGLLDRSTRLLITSAIYFKSKWLDPFSKESTKPRPFYPSAGDSVLVPTMFREGEYVLVENDTCSVLTLPYEKEELDMIVVLPRDRDGLKRVEEALDNHRLQSLMLEQSKMKVRVYLPSFELQTVYDLKSTLQELGAEAAFIPGQADFSGMTDAEQWFVSDVFQKGYVKVDEEGTEAAAVTLMTLKSLGYVDGGKPRIFRADHPFLFLIRDRITDCILFMGRVANPLEG